jgi:hypothetical protein
LQGRHERGKQARIWGGRSIDGLAVQNSFDELIRQGGLIQTA